MLGKPKLWLGIGILLLVIFLSGKMTLAQIEEKEVIGDGIAVGSSLASRQEALNRALRNAIEKGVGVLIDSETMVQNFQLLDDKVYSQVKGYVKSYQIVDDNQGKEGFYRIKLKAIVALGSLRKDLKALNIIMEKKGRPRIVIVFSETIDGLTQPGALTQTSLEKAFLENDFPVVDKPQMEMIKARDVTLSYNDPSKAAALGRRYGAEVVIIGQATSDLVDKSQPYGVSVYAYQAQVSAKAIKVDTARLIASENVSSTQRGNGRIPTAKESLDAAGQELADVMMSQIVEKWRSEVYNLVGVQLVCEKVNLDALNLFEDSLRNLDIVKSLSQRSFVNNIAIIDIEIEGNADILAAKLNEFINPSVEITARTQNRIDLLFK